MNSEFFENEEKRFKRSMWWLWIALAVVLVIDIAAALFIAYTLDRFYPIPQTIKTILQ